MGGGETAPTGIAPTSIEALPADFDKEQFRQSIKVKALKITKTQCQQYMKLLYPHLLNKPRMKNVMDVEGQPEWRLLLLEEGLVPEAFAERAINSSGGAKPGSPKTLHDVITADAIEVCDASVDLDYSHISSPEVLRRLLPPGSEVPTSFEEVGHIAHLNLREEILPYRKIIGTVLLEKHPRIRTVINKLGSIENEWRVFDMEVLAGEDDTITEVKQHGARFRLDFRRVYWNSRLEAEHTRLVEEWFKEGEVIADAMAGVGPFAVPAAKRGCKVLANDLNPDSHTWLVENININKVGASVCPYNIDGREFMRQGAGGKLPVQWTPPPTKGNKQTGKPAAAARDGNQAPVPSAVAEAAAAESPQMAPAFDHLVMNLPATAVEFLDALNGSFDPGMWAQRELPMVHVYAFLRADETTDDLHRRIEKALGGSLESSPIFHLVRDVAPNKAMYCASFRVPKALAFPETGEDSKRQRVI